MRALYLKTAVKMAAILGPRQRRQVQALVGRQAGEMREVLCNLKEEIVAHGASKPLLLCGCNLHIEQVSFCPVVKRQFLSYKSARCQDQGSCVESLVSCNLILTISLTMSIPRL
jgi:hypothetical protein